MEHTVKAVDADLDALSRDVVELGALAVQQVRDAVQAFADRDLVLAGRVVTEDQKLDVIDVQIERAAVRFIALRQPMADDLRRPITDMKTAMNLERCGDLAKNIGKRVGQMAQPAGGAQTTGIVELGQLVAGRLEQVMGAYGRSDPHAAFEVWSRDEEVDVLHDKVFREILASMTRDEGAVTVSAHLLFIAKNLERIGDHATNIAEMVHYAITGQDLEGRPKL